MNDLIHKLNYNVPQKQWLCKLRGRHIWTGKHTNESNGYNNTNNILHKIYFKLDDLLHFTEELLSLAPHLQCEFT